MEIGERRRIFKHKKQTGVTNQEFCSRESPLYQDYSFEEYLWR